MEQQRPQTQPSLVEKQPAWLLPLCQWGGVLVFLAGYGLLRFAKSGLVGWGFALSLTGLLLSTVSVMVLGTLKQKKVASMLAMGMTLLLAKGVLKLAES
ncbi:MAG: hypothetical protein MUF62_07050 [Chitinophagaceae bacterium]|nr:hypothetical protein [Chitinophagaceae bacterium]